LTEEKNAMNKIHLMALCVITTLGAACTKGTTGQGEPGANCWDVQGDVNNDGNLDHKDCQGAPGKDGVDGTNGRNCWETGTGTAADRNRDGRLNILDCQGAPGKDGVDGVTPEGCTSTTVFDNNGEACHVLECPPEDPTVLFCESDLSCVETTTVTGTVRGQSGVVKTCLYNRCTDTEIFCTFLFPDGHSTNGPPGGSGSVCRDDGTCAGGIICDTSGTIPYCPPPVTPDAGVPDSGPSDTGPRDGGRQRPQGCVAPNDAFGDNWCECISQRFCRTNGYICDRTAEPDFGQCVPDSTGDAGVDGGVADSGTPPDSGTPDSGQPDTSTPDTGAGDADAGSDGGTVMPDSGIMADTGIRDATAPDAVMAPDANAPDASAPDAAGDAGIGDAGCVLASTGNCFCANSGQCPNGYMCTSGSCQPQIVPAEVMWIATATVVQVINSSYSTLELYVWCTNSNPTLQSNPLQSITINRLATTDTVLRAEVNPYLGSTCTYNIHACPPNTAGPSCSNFWLPGEDAIPTQWFTMGRAVVRNRNTGVEIRPNVDRNDGPRGFWYEHTFR
jgi:hypothetical protein